MRISAHKRLRALPEAFTTKTLAGALGGDMKLASVYLQRWRSEGLVSSIGPRAGLHFNLQRNPQAETELRMDAIAYLFPGAVLAGASAVHAAGWTTQIPASMEIMVPGRRSFPEVNDCMFASRPLSWFRRAREHIARDGALPMVEPGFALADLWASGSWRPDPDDLEWDLIDLGKLEAVFAEFDLDLPAGWREEAEHCGPRYAP